MSVIKILILSLVSIVTLFILSKLMGNKEMSQLSMFDYIIGITIGSIAAELSTALEDNFIEPLIAMIVYALASIIISILSNKSIKIRRFFTGTSLVLLDNGKLYRRNFTKAKLDINEFLMQCRTNGYFHLSDIQTAILEANGKISFLPTSEKRPATPSDFNLTPPSDRVSVDIIVDGKLLKKNLYYTGNDEFWLQKQLVSQKVDTIEEIFLATCDSENRLSIYKKENLENSEDFFQ